MIWQQTARQAVAHLRKRTAGSGELARMCSVDAAFLDDALAPLVDAGNLMRINAFRNGAAEFDYRYSATWVPVDGDFDRCRGGGHAPVAAISPVAPPAPGRVEQRGLVESKPAHVLRPVLRDDHVANGKSGARSKAGRDALERAFHQPPQSLGWAPAPSPASQPEKAAADTQAIASPTHQESTVSTTRKARPTKATSARFQICALLLAKGDLSREELLANVSADRVAFNNAIFNAKAAGHITFLDKVDRYHLTRQGKKWAVAPAAAETNKPAGEDKSAAREPKPSLRETKRALAETGLLHIDVKPVPLAIDAGDLVCAINSRGELALDLGDQILIKFKPKHALVLTRFLAGNTVLEQMAQRGELSEVVQGRRA